MVTASVKARLTQGLQVLTSNQTIVMTFKMQNGKDENLALPVAAVPEIVERLIIAHNAAPGQKSLLYFGRREVGTAGTGDQAAAPPPATGEG